MGVVYDLWHRDAKSILTIFVGILQVLGNQLTEFAE